MYYYYTFMKVLCKERLQILNRSEIGMKPWLIYCFKLMIAPINLISLQCTPETLHKLSAFDMFRKQVVCGNVPGTVTVCSTIIIKLFLHTFWSGLTVNCDWALITLVFCNQHRPTLHVRELEGVWVELLILRIHFVVSL